MCVIVYKPVGKKLPSENTLKKCFETNSDGAGYMLPLNNKVVIKKGFMNFNAFKDSLLSTLKKAKTHIEDVPVVLHFRISTQGGVQKGLCHPYPVCEDYKRMRELDTTCDIGLCHNGIISRCSTSGYYGGHYDYKEHKWVDAKSKRLDYNDTMTFIKDYASLIIDNDRDFDKKPNKIKLLDRLCEYSKLAIMTASGKVTLIGDFIKKNDIYYSNLYHEVSATNFKGKCSSGFKSTMDIIGSNDDNDDDYKDRLPWWNGDYDD